jgi:hypothetical protein
MSNEPEPAKDSLDDLMSDFDKMLKTKESTKSNNSIPSPKLPLLNIQPIQQQQQQQELKELTNENIELKARLGDLQQELSVSIIYINSYGLF